MSDTTRTLLITGGIGLITVAVTPTPDDLTVVSPLAQLVAGVAIIFYASVAK